ncbi:hypothetical protein GGQ79_000802 [Ochrobactrum pecoris]|uniref:Uncharacterized protein n=1 Tax=Brucella pecoris TaxID=867683 RepID=A0AB34YPR7_9HYPH|nr:hypothetical protein [Brucella pecoris]
MPDRSPPTMLRCLGLGLFGMTQRFDRTDLDPLGSK